MGGGPDQVRVRHGRARLTVATAGPLDADDPLGRALDDYERGEARASAVARAYLRARVVDHSPSFTWRTAKLSELIPLVTSVSEDPRIEAASSRELADALLDLRHSKREADEAPQIEEPPPVPPAARAPEAAPAGPPRRWIPVAALAVCIAALGWGVARLLDGDGDSSAAERSETAAAATAIADSMDYVYDVYDLYLGGLQRELLAQAIDRAEAAIDEHGPALGPEGGLEPDGESGEALASADLYLDEASEFLDRLDATLARGRDAILERDEEIYDESVRLARKAETLEDEILALGSGTGDDSQADHYRPRPPD